MSQALYYSKKDLFGEASMVSDTTGQHHGSIEEVSIPRMLSSARKLLYDKKTRARRARAGQGKATVIYSAVFFVEEQVALNNTKSTS